MAGRIKLFVMLIVVICLIYVQQSFAAGAVICGTDTAQNPKKMEEKNIACDEIKRQSVDQDKDQSGAEKGGITSDGQEPGNQKPGNQEPGSQEPGDQESGDQESGSQEPGDQESGGQESGEQEPDSGGDKDDSGEETPPVVEAVIERYEVDIPPENGENGYYAKKPEIIIRHVSEAGVTKYDVKHGDKKTEEKVLEKKGDQAVIGDKSFSEGKNVLHIWMEDEKGEKVEKYELKKEILIDSKAPDIEMSAPNGFDAWYQGKATVSARGEDTGSKGVKLTCKVEGRTLEHTKSEKGEFEITQASSQGKGVRVTVIARDRAGNTGEKTKTVYLDNAAPKVEICGAENYSITGKPATLTCEIQEENVLREFSAEMVWENAKGKKKRQTLSGQETGDGKWIFQKELKKDGIYSVTVRAKDMAGYQAEDALQVIVDQSDPMIRYVGALDGQYLKSFQWAYPPRAMIQDLTTCTYEMRVDGQLYHAGKILDTEGRHKMQVRAADAAGNRAKAEAEFVIDHTAPQIVFENVEEGASYEEERTVRVKLRGAKDRIEKIQINGERQKLDPGRTMYEYALRECKDYEIVVNAGDQAGNTSEKKIYFHITPKETFVKKIGEPITTYLSGNRKDEAEKPGRGKDRFRERTEKKIRIPVQAAGAAGMCVLLAMGVIGCRLYKRKSR